MKQFEKTTCKPTNDCETYIDTATHNQNNISTVGVGTHFGNSASSSTRIYPRGLDSGLPKPSK